MSATFVKLSKDVDEKPVRTLAKLAGVASSRGQDLLLLGAFARDLLFWHVHGIECHRATMDVDIVVQVKNWKAYHGFRTALTAAGFAGEEVNHPEKLRDKETEVEVDLLPFGEIAEDGQTVIWPEDNSRWSVVGIQDAFDHALLFKIADGGLTHTLRFVSAPALVMLKIVATHDRPEARHKKDAADMGFVIENYLAAGQRNRLKQAPHADILGMVGSDLDRATAVLLGRDMSAMMSPKTRTYVVDLLGKEVKSKGACLLTQGLQRFLCKGDFSRARQVLSDMLDGLGWSA